MPKINLTNLNEVLEVFLNSPSDNKILKRVDKTTDLFLTYFPALTKDDIIAGIMKGNSVDSEAVSILTLTTELISPSDHSVTPLVIVTISLKTSDVIHTILVGVPKEDE